MNTATILTTTGATLTQVRPTTSCMLLTRFYSTCPGLDFQLFRVRAINQGEEDTSFLDDQNYATRRSGRGESPRQWPRALPVLIYTACGSKQKMDNTCLPFPTHGGCVCVSG